MDNNKCRNSVFCTLFLVCFLVGTICGILLFRWLSNDKGAWVLRYGASLLTSERIHFASLLLSIFRPALLAFLAGVVSFGYRAVPVLVFVRGALMAYCGCVFLSTGNIPLMFFLRGAGTLVLFYSASCWSWCRWTCGSFF